MYARLLNRILNQTILFFRKRNIELIMQWTMEYDYVKFVLLAIFGRITSPVWSH